MRGFIDLILPVKRCSRGTIKNRNSVFISYTRNGGR